MPGQFFWSLLVWSPDPRSVGEQLLFLCSSLLFHPVAGRILQTCGPKNRLVGISVPLPSPPQGQVYHVQQLSYNSSSWKNKNTVFLMILQPLIKCSCGCRQKSASHVDSCLFHWFRRNTILWMLADAENFVCTFEMLCFAFDNILVIIRL